MMVPSLLPQSWATVAVIIAANPTDSIFFFVNSMANDDFGPVGRSKGILKRMEALNELDRNPKSLQS